MLLLLSTKRLLLSLLKHSGAYLLRKLLLIIDLPLLLPVDRHRLGVHDALVEVRRALVLGRVDQVLLLRRRVVVRERGNAVGSVAVRARILRRTERVGRRGVVVELGRKLVDRGDGRGEVAAEWGEVHVGGCVLQST